MNQPTEEQKEQLVQFIGRHVLFFDSYANWVFLIIAVAILAVIYIVFRRFKQWLIRIPIVLSLLFILTINILFAILINNPLRPFVKSLATITRAINSIPPSFEFKNVRTGDTHTLNEFKGRIVLLNFWGTYCGPCIEEMPDLKRLEEEMDGDLVVISLSDESEGKIAGFLAEHGAPGIVGYFSKNDWITLGTFRPMTVYIDKAGKVREFFFGKSDYNSFKRIAEKYL
jgi:thiol-disulfide isomerase/thioredoxin